MAPFNTFLSSINYFSTMFKNFDITFKFWMFFNVGSIIAMSTVILFWQKLNK